MFIQIPVATRLLFDCFGVPLCKDVANIPHHLCILGALAELVPQLGSVWLSAFTQGVTLWAI